MNGSETALEALLEFLNAAEAGIAAAKHVISQAKGLGKWDPNKIKFVMAQGAKGPYERYPGEGEKAESTSDYRMMLADIKQHGGKMSRDNFFYWVFSDCGTVGRKKRK